MSSEPITAGPRTVLVTGGSSGIGAEVVRIAADRGWTVWLGYAAGRERAARLARELTEAGADVTPVYLPLDHVAVLEGGMTRIFEDGPLPQAAILCASPQPDVKSLLKLTSQDFRHQLECAVIGNHALLTQLWRHCFRSNGGGHVAAVLSAAQGPRPTPHMASYVAAKAGLEALLHAAAAEWGAGGLRISIMHPGFVDTPMLEAFPPLLLERALGGAAKPLRAREVAAALWQAIETPPAPGAVAEIPLNYRKAS